MTTGTPSLDVNRVLARNAAWNYAGFAVNLVANFALFPFVVHRIGDAAGGLWLLLSSVTGYMGLLELGLVPALTQFVAAARAQGRQSDIDRLASTTLALLATLGLVPLALALASPRVVEWLNVPADLQGQGALAVAVGIVGFGLRMPQATFQALLLGCQRQDRTTRLWIGLTTAKAIGTVAVLAWGAGVVGLVAMEAALQLLAGWFQVRWARTELPHLSLGWRHVTADDARRLVFFGSSLVALNLTALVIEQTDRLVVGAFLPISQVTHYSAGWKLYAFAYAVPTTLVQALAPVAAELFGRGDLATLQRTLLRLTKYSVGVALPLAIGLAFCAPFLLRWWMGPSFVPAAVVVQILAVSFVVTAFNHAGYSVLVGMRAVGPLLWRYQVPQAVLNLGLSVALVRPLGIAGVAIGTAAPAILLQAVFTSYLLRRTRLPARAFASAVVVPTLLPAVLCFAPLVFTAWAVDPVSWQVPAAAVACGGAYGAVFWFWSMSPSERRQLLSPLLMRGIDTPGGA